MSALAELKSVSTGDEATDFATAKGYFTKGARMYERGDYDEMTMAGELADRPALLFSRAQALRKLGGRREEAIALYQAYVDSGDGNRKEDAEQMLALLRTHGAGP